MHIFLLT